MMSEPALNTLFPDLEIERAQREVKRQQRAGTFTDNMKLPVHRWFRYSAGFSAEWVEAEIGKRRRPHVFDPFSGSGTTLIAAETQRAPAFGQESHPFVARVAQAKLQWRTDPTQVRTMSEEIKARAAELSPERHFSNLLLDCYDDETLHRLEALRLALLELKDDSSAWKLCWLAYVGIIRATSHAGTAQWQYVLPNKRKSAPKEAYGAFSLKIEQILEDMTAMAAFRDSPPAKLFWEDARKQGEVPDNWASLIITSPPYANNYDYADATRLEMTMLGEIEGWGQLQDTVRTHLVRSCTQHVSAQVSETYNLLTSPVLAPIADELEEVVRALDAERFNHGGKKNYHTMVAHYFHDLGLIWQQLRRIAQEGAEVCFVVGDSAPYGVYVPVDRWLGELAVNAGFAEYRFEKLRDRNTKWKNRKHQVPLHEGRLWVNG